MKNGSRVESSKITNRRDEDMNGKLAKQIRRAVNFSPNAAREYREENVGHGFLYRTHTAVATGCRAAYQKLKTSVLGARRGRR